MRAIAGNFLTRLGITPGGQNASGPATGCAIVIEIPVPLSLRRSFVSLPEGMPQCAQNVLDTADIVKDAILQQPEQQALRRGAPNDTDWRLK
jgi:hypothetical protein